MAELSSQTTFRLSLEVLVDGWELSKMFVGQGRRIWFVSPQGYSKWPTDENFMNVGPYIRVGD